MWMQGGRSTTGVQHHNKRMLKPMSVGANANVNANGQPATCHDGDSQQRNNHATFAKPNNDNNNKARTV